MAQILESSHDDYIHDIAFDHYGRRIATCSGDRTVKIWDLDENGEWTSEQTDTGSGSEWKAHLSAVTSLSWGHPEFGQLLATSGSDGFACIWEECTRTGAGEGGGYSGSGGVVGTTRSSMNMASTPMGMGGLFHNDRDRDRDQTAAGGTSASSSRWAERVRLTDARKSLSCVKFAPRHQRLQIATGSADGTVRIYEAVDVTRLNQWLLKNSIEVENDTASDLGVTCLDWCSGRFEPPTLVVGSSLGNVHVYRYSDASRKWGLYLKLEGHVSPRKGVLDVAWSPDVGRSYHLISSCGRDGELRVHRLKKGTGSSGEGNGNNNNSEGSGLKLESCQKIDSQSDPWRCAWNVTGTVLASSGDSGVVKLWKSDFRGVWKCVADVHGSLRDQAGMPMAP